MKAKRLFIVGLALSLVFVFSACSPSGKSASSAPAATTPITLRVAHNNPVDHFIHKAAVDWGERMSKASNGAVKLEIYPAESIGMESEVCDAIVAGVGVDAYLGSTSPFTPHDKKFTFFEGPYLFQSRQHLVNFYNSDFMQKTLNDELAKNCNIRSIGAIYYGTRQVTSNVKATSPAEFKSKGLKLRAPKAQMFMDTVNAMGAAATPIDFAETYLALQQGVAHGQENPPASIKSMKFYEVQKYLILTGHMVQENHIFLSETTRKKVGEATAALLQKTAKEAAEVYNKISYDTEDALLKELGKSMEIVEVDRAAFRKAMEPVYVKYHDIWGQDLLDAINACVK